MTACDRNSNGIIHSLSVIDCRVCCRRSGGERESIQNGRSGERRSIGNSRVRKLPAVQMFMTVSMNMSRNNRSEDGSCSYRKLKEVLHGGCDWRIAISYGEAGYAVDNGIVQQHLCNDRACGFFFLA